MTGGKAPTDCYSDIQYVSHLTLLQTRHATQQCQRDTKISTHPFSAMSSYDDGNLSEGGAKKLVVLCQCP